jgi:hypothetical protein
VGVPLVIQKRVDDYVRPLAFEHLAAAMVSLPAHAQARCQPRRGAVAGIHARYYTVQTQAVDLVEGKIQYRGAGLSCVPLPCDVGMEDVTDLSFGVVCRAEEEHYVTDQPSGRG